MSFVKSLAPLSVISRTAVVAGGCEVSRVTVHVAVGLRATHFFWLNNCVSAIFEEVRVIVAVLDSGRGGWRISLTFCCNSIDGRLYSWTALDQCPLLSIIACSCISYPYSDVQQVTLPLCPVIVRHSKLMPASLNISFMYFPSVLIPTGCALNVMDPSRGAKGLL